MPETRCPVPPAGWTCTREPGHGGPCAAALDVRIQTTCVDPETRAVIWNEGYEAAMSQHLADDPTAADDWLQSKLAEARAQALREAAERVQAALDSTRGSGVWVVRGGVAGVLASLHGMSAALDPTDTPRTTETEEQA